MKHDAFKRNSGGRHKDRMPTDPASHILNHIFRSQLSTDPSIYIFSSAVPFAKYPPREIMQFFKIFLGSLPGQKRPEKASTENNKKQQLFWSAGELTKNNRNNTLNILPRCNDSTKCLAQPCATLRNFRRFPPTFRRVAGNGNQIFCPM